MEKLIFRADGNSTTGLGHLYRVFALIEMFRENYDCVLVTRAETTPEVIPESYKRVILPLEVILKEEGIWMKQNISSEDCWLIADGYHFDANYQRQIKEAGFKLLYVDDFCQEHMVADVVVNHAIGVKRSNYNAEAYTRFALGAEYAILRPLFLLAATQPRQLNGAGEIFVCFGGADPLNLTLKVVKALLTNSKVKRINVVLGAAYTHEELINLSTGNPHLHVFRNLNEKELLNVMQRCDFAIAPASNILYELFAVKMPVLSGYYVDNQKKIYKGCLEKKLIFDGGNLASYSVSDFEIKINELINGEMIGDYLKAQAEVLDGKSKLRFLSLLQTITFRKANESDMMQVFEWSNDKLSRANSYFSEPIALETHRNWFKHKLSDPKSLIFIAEIDRKPAGMVRYSLEETNAVVGVLIGEMFRGRGLAVDFLVETAKLYFQEQKLPVFAYIKIQNVASVKSFEKAGYKKLKEEIVHGAKSVVYKLEKHDV